MCSFASLDKYWCNAHGKKTVFADLFGNKLHSLSYDFTEIEQCNANANHSERHFNYHCALIASLLWGTVRDRSTARMQNKNELTVI